MISSDLILFNGRIRTMNKEPFWVEAIAIKGDKIISIGKSDEILSGFRGKTTKLINLEGKYAMPGFIDSHVHFLSGGLALLEIDLTGKNSIQEIQEEVKKRVMKSKKGEWIKGYGWNHNLFPERKWPIKEDLDQVASENPVILKRVCGHTAWVNSLALELAKINRDTPQPQGGFIEKNKKGELTGVLKEKAIEIVERIIPLPTKEKTKKAIQLALKKAKEFGVTSVHDMPSSLPSKIFLGLEIYEDLYNEKKLTLRIYKAADFSQDLTQILEFKERFKNLDSKFIKFGPLKGFIDGSLGSSTAALFEPYADNPLNKGMIVISKKELIERIVTFDENKFQLALHAIGDKAIDLALEGFREAFKRNVRFDSRHRIEHAQVIRCRNLEEFACLKIIPSMQPAHAISDMEWVERKLGSERVKMAYPWRSFLEKKIVLAFGSDWPVESLNPMKGVYAALTRQSENGLPEKGWIPEQKISLNEALWAYTIGSTYASFDERIKGSIKPGKLADIVILSKNLYEIPSKEILDTEVVMTILGGKIIYKKD
ncbi:MAG: amidohydrolase [Candidatus Aminicenantia bacterium]